MMKIVPSGAVLGATVEGVDLSRPLADGASPAPPRCTTRSRITGRTSAG